MLAAKRVKTHTYHYLAWPMEASLFRLMGYWGGAKRGLNLHMVDVDLMEG